MMREKKTKAGKTKSPKTRRRTGLPHIDLIEAIDYAKKAYTSFSTNLKTHPSMAEAMGIKKAYASRVFGELSDYGLIEKVGPNWKISDFGKRAIEGDRSTVEQMLMTNKILGDLVSTYEDFAPEKDVLEQHVRRKYPALNSSYVADRFLKDLDYLNKLKPGKAVILKKSDLIEPKAEWFKVIQLKYALNPLSKKEKSSLAKQVAEELGRSDDESIKELSDQMKLHLDKPNSLKLLVNSVLGILHRKYSDLVLNPEKRETPEKAKEK